MFPLISKIPQLKKLHTEYKNKKIRIYLRFYTLKGDYLSQIDTGYSNYFGFRGVPWDDYDSTYEESLDDLFIFKGFHDLHYTEENFKGEDYIIKYVRTY